MLSWILNHKMEVLTIATAAITGASVLLKALAPMTKTIADDKWLARLEKLLAVLEKLALNVRR